MPTVAEIIQALYDNRLDLAGMERDPQYVGSYRLTNQMVRALAHLAGTDGTFSRLLRCGEDGALWVTWPGGLPTFGSDATGADSYALVVTAPARICRYLHCAVGNYGAVISLDGGVTDHFALPANTERLFPGLEIPASAEVHAKNLTAGSNYSNLYVSVY
jgi:hypothetical protein